MMMAVGDFVCAPNSVTKAACMPAIHTPRPHLVHSHVHTGRSRLPRGSLPLTRLQFCQPTFPAPYIIHVDLLPDPGAAASAAATPQHHAQEAGPLSIIAQARVGFSRDHHPLPAQVPVRAPGRAALHSPAQRGPRSRAPARHVRLDFGLVGIRHVVCA